MKRLFFLAFLMVVMCPLYLFAQVTATGVVVDASTGEPIIGASILEEGTTNGTITDFDGNFLLSVTKDAQLVVSYVGYKSQTLKASSLMRIFNLG